METLFTSAAEHQAKERQERLAEYFRFLAGVDIAKPSPEDAATLSGHLTALGKLAADAKRDWQEIQSVRGRIGHVAQTEGAEAKVDSAYATLQAALAERQAENHRQNEKVKQANASHIQAEADSALRREAIRFLRELKESNPPLHAAVVAPPADPPSQRKRR